MNGEQYKQHPDVKINHPGNDGIHEEDLTNPASCEYCHNRWICKVKDSFEQAFDSARRYGTLDREKGGYVELCKKTLTVLADQCKMYIEE